MKEEGEVLNVILVIVVADSGHYFILTFLWVCLVRNVSTCLLGVAPFVISKKHFLPLNRQ